MMGIITPIVGTDWPCLRDPIFNSLLIGSYIYKKPHFAIFPHSYDDNMRSLLLWFKSIEKQGKINLWFNSIFAVKRMSPTFSRDSKGVNQELFWSLRPQ